MSEIWADVPSWEGYYYVSNQGDIKNAKWQTLKKRIDNGYYRVCLTHKDRKEFVLVHRLVLSVFGKPQKDKPYVNHKNGITTDNRVENLEWVSRSENMKHAYRVLKIPQSRPMLGRCGKNHPRSRPVLCIEDGVETEYVSITEAANKTNVPYSRIWGCCNNRHYKSVSKTKWRYKN